MIHQVFPASSYVLQEGSRYPPCLSALKSLLYMHIPCQFFFITFLTGCNSYSSFKYPLLILSFPILSEKISTSLNLPCSTCSIFLSHEMRMKLVIQVEYVMNDCDLMIDNMFEISLFLHILLSSL